MTSQLSLKQWPTVALATSEALPDLDADEHALLQSLQDADIDARPVVWSDPDVDWASISLCVIRSTWDYTQHLPAFLNWLQHVQDSGCQVQNSLEIIRWNVNKQYLCEMEQAGIAVVPTVWLNAGATVNLSGLMKTKGWASAVFKPCVSASGNDTYRITGDHLSAFQEITNQLLTSRDCMIQPYLSSVSTHGELSMVFVDHQFTHAVIKRPAESDFRVQEHLGGQTQAATPSESSLALATQGMKWLEQRFGGKTLYARVDVMFDDAGHPLLSELEVVEPSLYQRHQPEGKPCTLQLLQAIRARISAAAIAAL